MKLLWLILALLLNLAQAQTLHFGVSTNNYLVFEPELRLTNLELRDTKIDLRLAFQNRLELGISMKQASSFGPLGNITLQGQADVSSAAEYQIKLYADGVLGSVAATLGGQVFNTTPGTFALADAFEDTRPRFAHNKSTQGVNTQGVSLDLGLSYRLSRSQVLSAYPSIYFTNQGLAAKLSADYKLYKLFDPNDGSVLVQTYLDPTGKSYGAVGFQFDLNEKNWPSVSGSAWLSLGHQGLLPGFRASLSQSFKSSDSKLGLALSLEPYRSDFIPYYLTAFYTRGFDFGTLEANLYMALNTEGLPPVTLKVGYGYKF